MSWDATLTDDRGHVEGDWNFTHNTNPMIHDALDVIGWELPPHPHFPGRKGSWYDVLDGADGPAGAAYLDAIIRQLEADPARYEAMNPPNKWGSYTNLLRVLREMRAAVPEWPCRWSANG